MRTIHIVSHTHWDREWYQTYQHFRIRLVHLMDNLLALLDGDPRYQHFMLDGQTIVLEDFLAVRPERREDIRNYVQSGRLLIGPWYILPDEFLVSPEALIRNLIIGGQTSAEFGPKMQIGYIPDPFGHIGQMPQILNGFGIRTASVMRGLDDEPCEFWWRSPDGSTVFMAYMRDGYGNAAGLPVHNLELFCNELIRLGDSLGEHSAAKNLLLMFGTDHMEPPADTSRALAAACDTLRGIDIKHSTLPDYIETVMDELSAKGADLPVISGELRSPKRSPLLPGVLSTRMWIKQRNHACEVLLERWAEPFTAWASLASGDIARPGYKTSERLQSPGGMLRQAWQLLLTCQPHDSICGCSIDQVHEEMLPRFDQVDQIGEILTTQSLNELAEFIDTSCDPNWAAMAVCVFNPMPGVRTDPVEVTLDLPKNLTNFEIIDQHGQPMPHQTIGLGRQELLNVVLTPQEFLTAAASVQEGRVSGYLIREVEYQILEEEVSINLQLSEHGSPNLEAYNRFMQELQVVMSRPTIKRFIVQAHSADQIRLQFIANRVPGPGVQVFWVAPLPAREVQPVKLPPLARLALPLVTQLIKIPAFNKFAQSFGRTKTKKPYFIQNEFLAVEADPLSGTLKLLDKRTNQLFEGLNQLVDGGDRGDEYNYCPPSWDELVNLPRLRDVKIERTAVNQQMTLAIIMSIPKSLHPARDRRSAEQVELTVTCTITLWTGVARLEIHTEVTNRASDHRLRVHFPTPYKTQTAEYDGHFEIIQRRVGRPVFDQNWIEEPRPEAPQRLFCGVNEGRYGLLLAARGLPEVEVRHIEEGFTHTELALTLLRCVGWLSRDDLSNRKGHAGPGMAVPGAQMVGTYSFDYALIPYFGAPTEAYALARDFHAPLRGAVTSLHAGKIAQPAFFVQVSPLLPSEPQNFILSTIKPPEEGAGLIVRGFNQGSQAQQFTLRPWRRFGQVQMTLMNEQVVGSIKPDVDGSFVFTANPFEVLTFRLSDPA